LRHDIPQVSEEENEVLVAPFSGEEVKLAVFDMEHNKAPGLDGFPTEFFHFLGGCEARFDEPLLRIPCWEATYL
jgi:hypothetical protein